MKLGCVLILVVALCGCGLQYTKTKYNFLTFKSVHNMKNSRKRFNLDLDYGSKEAPPVEHAVIVKWTLSNGLWDDHVLRYYPDESYHDFMDRLDELIRSVSRDPKIANIQITFR